MNAYYEEFKQLSQYTLDDNLMLACQNGDLEKVKYLLNSTEIPKNANIRAQEGDALIRASRNNHYDVMEYLLYSTELRENLSIHVQHDFALVQACEDNNVEMAQYLLTSPRLKEHINVHTAGFGPQKSDRPFLIAYIYQQYEILQYLILDFNIEKNEAITKLIENENNEITDIVKNWFEYRELNKVLTIELDSKAQSQKNNKSKI